MVNLPPCSSFDLPPPTVFYFTAEHKLKVEQSRNAFPLRSVNWQQGRDDCELDHLPLFRGSTPPWSSDSSNTSQSCSPGGSTVDLPSITLNRPHDMLPYASMFQQAVPILPQGRVKSCPSIASLPLQAGKYTASTVTEAVVVDTRWLQYISGADADTRCHYIVDGEECGFVSRRHATKRHIETTHLSIKRWTCEICSKCYTQKASLTRHVTIHTGETPFPCKYPDCTREFNDRSRRHKHMIDAHKHKPQPHKRRNRIRGPMH